MLKILHTADWHLDAPIVGRTEVQTAYLREELRQLPDRIASLCKSEGCQLLLLAGDVFDGDSTWESRQRLYTALEELGIPVCIAPGNHDCCTPDAPYLTEDWPENVHIFTKPVLERIDFPQLDCSVYGAGYGAMDCPGLLEGFTAQSSYTYQIGLFHSDPSKSSSPYAPFTPQQARDSGLHYLALGHVHKGGSFRAGETLCAWPGCPMGRGYDETGIKGALLVTLDSQTQARFLPLNTPRFYDETLDVGDSAADALAALLPPVETRDFYRVTLTGYAAQLDIQGLRTAFSHIENLELRNRTVPEVDLWSNLDEDSLEGVYFQLLHQAANSDVEKLSQAAKLAARISRQLLDGQEVLLP